MHATVRLVCTLVAIVICVWLIWGRDQTRAKDAVEAMERRVQELEHQNQGLPSDSEDSDFSNSPGDSTSVDSYDPPVTAPIVDEPQQPPVSIPTDFFKKNGEDAKLGKRMVHM